MKGIIILLLLTGCAQHEFDFNPATTIIRQLIKVNNEVE
jgi:hypothetical protein|tara:strand:- start:556 stop:672 length:117 start_codon:yes stop_codon:yes gene_type:complete